MIGNIGESYAPTQHIDTARSGAPGTAVFRHGIVWIPALLGILAICGESTRVMGADHTAIWLNRLCSPLVHLPVAQMTTLNHTLRKCGHFFGYGTLGLVLLRGWLTLLQTRTTQTWARLRLSASGFAVLSVAFLASMDELHQSFLPNRTACVSDVVLDTVGAVLLISCTMLALSLHRKRTLTRLLRLRTLRQWQTQPWLLRGTLPQQLRS